MIQKHAALLGIPDVKVTGVRFNGPSMMNDSLLSGSVDIVGGSPNGMFALWAKTVGTPREVRAIGAWSHCHMWSTSTDPDIKTIADLGKCNADSGAFGQGLSPAVSVQMAAVKLYGLKEFDRLRSADGRHVAGRCDDCRLLSGAGEINCSVALPPFMQCQLQTPRCTLSVIV